MSKNTKKIFNINENIKLKGHMCFVCGSALENKAEDKRIITVKFINEHYSGSVVGFIIDDFLNLDSFISQDIDLKLLEELIAEVSIFIINYIDSMSAATELGLFTSKMTTNKQILVVPRVEDIIIRDYGYFTNAVMKNASNDLVYYAPKIKCLPMTNIDIKKRYYFINNEIPSDLTNAIDSNIVNNDVYSSFVINILKSENFKNNDKCYKKTDLVYTLNENDILTEIDFYISEYVIFRCLVSQREASEFLDINSLDKLNIFVDKFICDFKKILIDTMKYYKMESFDYEFNLNISTHSEENINDIVRYFSELLKLFFDKNKLNKKYFSPTQTDIEFDNVIIEKKSTLYMIKHLFNVFKEINTLITSLQEKKLKNFNHCYKEFTVNNGKKTRVFVTYKNDELGIVMSDIHKKIKDYFDKNYEYSDASYAYRKKYSSHMCISKHKDSNSFFKCDIKSFFDNIDLGILKNKLSKFLGLENDKNLNILIHLLSHKKKIPLGLITSPYISDLYLNQFDEEIYEYCNEHNVVYTRYSDDFLFSHSDINFCFDNLKDFVENKLTDIKLTLNNKKNKLVFFPKNTYVKYLGLNIVLCSRNDNRDITVSKSYAKRVGEQILNFSNNKGLITENQLNGKLKYIAFVDNNRLDNIRAQLNSRLRQDDLEEAPRRKLVFFLEYVDLLRSNHQNYN